MTIGPEPRMRMRWMSSRLGNCLELLDEGVEELDGVVWAGAGLRVVLHAAGGGVEQANALDGAVVEGHVGQLRLAEVRLQPLAGLTADREAVVLGGDGDPPRAQV